MSIEERLDTMPQPWKPEAGDKLIGTVVELEERTSEYGSYPSVTVRVDNGEEIVFHGFHTVAKEELARKKPCIGDRIGIAYFGVDQAKGYERYRIVVEPPEPPVRELPF
jgi:hypothetical protein